MKVLHFFHLAERITDLPEMATKSNSEILSGTEKNWVETQLDTSSYGKLMRSNYVWSLNFEVRLIYWIGLFVTENYINAILNKTLQNFYLITIYKYSDYTINIKLIFISFIFSIYIYYYDKITKIPSYIFSLHIRNPTSRRLQQQIAAPCLRSLRLISRRLLRAIILV